MNFAQLKKQFGQVVQSAASTAKDLTSQVAGAKALRDYVLEGQAATAGLNDIWKVYNARSRKEGAHNRAVSVWVVDKKAQGGQLSQISQQDWDAVLAVARSDATALTRLKHPAVVQVIEPMEETRTQLVMVTEAVYASAENLLRQFEGLPRGLMESRKDVRLSELEVKAGLMQVADALHFLHMEASLVHCAIAPPSIVISAQGSWKLCGLALATKESFNSSDAHAHRFNFGSSAPPLWRQLTQPQLAYTAPEVAGASGALGPPADIFSFGCLVYELLAGQPLLRVTTSLTEHSARMASLGTADFSAINPQLTPVLRAMLAPSPASRPPASAFTACSYFQGDTVLRAIRFLDTLLQRDDLQKAAFLKDLAQLWPQCDARLLRYRVLPALLTECRNESMQPVVLPLVLRIAEQQEQQDFVDYSLPALEPICASATGDALLVLVKNAGLLAKAMPRQATASILVPLLARAADQGGARCQEEVLQQMGRIQESVDYPSLRTQLLPRAHRLALGTTSAAVRAAAFAALASLAQRFCETEQSEAMVATMQQVTAVDRSTPTVVGCLNLCQALGKSAGARFAAERLIPILAPLLAAPATPHEQFVAALRTVREMLDELELGRGGQRHDVSAGSTPTHVTGQTFPDAVWPAPPPPAMTSSHPQPSWMEPPAPHPTAKSPSSSTLPEWTGLAAAQMASTSPAKPYPHSSNSNSSPAMSNGWQPAPIAVTASAFPLGSQGRAQQPQPAMPSTSGVAGDPFEAWPPAQPASGNTPPSASASADPFDFTSRPAAAVPGPHTALADSSALFQDPSWQDPPLSGWGSSQQPTSSSAAVGRPPGQSRGWQQNQASQNGSHTSSLFPAASGYTQAAASVSAPDMFAGMTKNAAAGNPMSLQPPKLAPPPAGKAAPVSLASARTQTSQSGRLSTTGKRQDSLI